MKLKNQIFTLSALIVLMLAGTNALAEVQSCNDIDLRSEALGAVRNQGNSGWCGNFVAADLLSHKIGKRISAVQVGVHYYILRSAAEALFLDKVFAVPEGQYHGALLSSALKINMQQTACSEDSVPDSMVELEESVHTTIAQLRPRRATTLSKSCESIRPPAGLKVVGHESRSGGGLSEIQNQLMNQNIAGALIDMKSLFRLGASSSIVDRKLGNHYVSIVGQRKGASECEFLVRNSWGGDCVPVPGVQCQQGHYWFPASQLKASLKSVISLQD